MTGVHAPLSFGECGFCEGALVLHVTQKDL